jgi:hypothetical protein
MTEQQGSIVYDQFAKAFLGNLYWFGKSDSVAVYDYKKVIRILVKDGMSKRDAIEWFDFNVLGGYLGETTPVFLNRCTLEEFGEMQ